MTVTTRKINDYTTAILVNGMRVDTAYETAGSFRLDDGSRFNTLNRATMDVTNMITDY